MKATYRIIKSPQPCALHHGCNYNNPQFNSHLGLEFLCISITSCTCHHGGMEPMQIVGQPSLFNFDAWVEFAQSSMQPSRLVRVPVAQCSGEQQFAHRHFLAVPALLGQQVIPCAIWRNWLHALLYPQGPQRCCL